MKYYPPLNATSENADYQNLNAANHQWHNTMPDARGFGAVQREIINALKKANIKPDENKLDQLAEAILKIAQDGLFKDIGAGLQITEGVLSVLFGDGLKAAADGKTTLNIDDTLKIVNGILSAAAWIGTVKSKVLTGTVIQPEVNPNVIYKDLTEATTFTFDNSKLANLPDGAQFRFELQLNMPAAVGFCFDPIPQFDLDNEPDFSEPGLYFINFHTFDKGATWYLEVVNRFAARPSGGA